MNKKKLTLAFLVTGLVLIMITSSVYSPLTVSADQLKQTRPPLYLALIWHQHQPNYQDPSTGRYEQPWVFMHSSNSYPYMARILLDYDVNITINLTPSLLKQLDDYTSGNAWDRRIEVAKMSEASMSFENKSLIVTHFFDINPQFVTGRYKWIQDKLTQYSTLEEKVAALTNDEILDLKVMFFLRWINPFFYNDPSESVLPSGTQNLLNLLNGLIDDEPYSSSKFTHTDLNNVLSAMETIASKVVPLHVQAMNTGRVELMTTPFYHPILPLLINLTSARETDEGNKDLPLPKQNTGWVEDAQAQINKGVQSYYSHFGTYPHGMWPSEEAVSADIIPLVANANMTWIVTDEGVLRRGLGVSSTSPEQLYQMYKVEKDGKSIAVVFRDPELSNKIGFKYSGMDPADAAEDFVNSLKQIYNNLANAPEKDYLVTVALDGENAWEYYTYDVDGDGKNEYTANLFRQYLYQKLVEAQNEGWLKTVTPQQYLEKHPLDTLPTVPLATGSWAWDFNTWIGEPDENIAWDRLITARKTLVNAEQEGSVQNSSAAWEAIYAAEGSDWFWWYGTDQNSGHDEVFDWGFKTFLRSVYENIGWTHEQILQQHPELFLRLKPSISATFADRMDATIDGTASSGEWDNAYKYNDTEVNDTAIDNYYIGISSDNTKFYFRLDLAGATASSKTGTNDYFVAYFNNPTAEAGEIFPLGLGRNLSRTLGYELYYAVVYFFNTSKLMFYTYNSTSNSWSTPEQMTESATAGDVLEFEVNIDRLNYQPGDYILTSVVYVVADGTYDVAPQDGPLRIQIPMSGVTFQKVFEMDDPEGDEYGIYPTDQSFSPGHGLFDILHFAIGYKEDQLIASFKFSELTNPWNSPRGFSHPLIHIYFDIDRIPGSGSTETVENANADIDPNFAWEVMVKLDGWEAFLQYANGTQLGGVDGYGDTLEKTVTLTAPLNLIGTPTEDWAYVVIVGSQDFSNFREVLAQNGQWKFGGGDDGPYDPNVIDMLVPEGVNQEDLLTSYDVATQTRVKLVGVGPKVSFQADNVPPNVTITNPADGAIIKAGPDGLAKITLNFTATDNVKVDHINIFLDNILIYSKIPGNTTSVIIDAKVGKHTVVVQAWDGPDEDKANYAIAKVTFTVVQEETTSEGGFLPVNPIIPLFTLLILLPILKKHRNK